MQAGRKNNDLFVRRSADADYPDNVSIISRSGIDYIDSPHHPDNSSPMGRVMLSRRGGTNTDRSRKRPFFMRFCMNNGGHAQVISVSISPHRQA